MISSMSFVFKIVTFYDKGVFLDRTMGFLTIKINLSKYVYMYSKWIDIQLVKPPKNWGCRFLP